MTILAADSILDRDRYHALRKAGFDTIFAQGPAGLGEIMEVAIDMLVAVYDGMPADERDELKREIVARLEFSYAHVDRASSH
jgi:hypothetical protein